MGVYTDPRLLGVREAVERLPSLPINTGSGERPTKVTVTGCNSGQKVSSAGTLGRIRGGRDGGEQAAENLANSSERPTVTTVVTVGQLVGPAGFEPTTSCTPSKRICSVLSLKKSIFALRGTEFD